MSHQTFLNIEVIQSMFSDHDMVFLQNGGTDSIQSKKKLPAGDFVEIDHLILKCTWKCKRSGITKTILKKAEQSVSTYLTWLQELP